MKLFEITFSPTGGTAKVAAILAEGFGLDSVKIDLTDASFAYDSIAADDLCILAVPSYGGRVPACAAERIARLSGNGAMAVLTVVYGNREFDDTLAELKSLAENAGFKPVAAVAAIAEHSILRTIATGRPDQTDRTELAGFAEKIAAAIRDHGAASLIVPGQIPESSPKGSAIKPAADDSCIQCGLCAEKCPAHAIPADHPEQTDAAACISCMRCVSICPVSARSIASAALSNVEQFLTKVASARKANQLFL